MWSARLSCDLTIPWLPAGRRSAVIDLAIAMAWFVVCYASEPVSDSLLRRGHGLVGVFALAAYQFTFEGLGLLRFGMIAFPTRDSLRATPANQLL
ncbi:MAG: hypothetical protein WCA20_04765 [Candidatus Sulfotelmatobacter sp.]